MLRRREAHRDDLGSGTQLHRAHLEGRRQLHRGDLEGESQLHGRLRGAGRGRTARRGSSNYGWCLDRFRHDNGCGWLRNNRFGESSWSIEKGRLRHLAKLANLDLCCFRFGDGLSCVRFTAHHRRQLRNWLTLPNRLRFGLRFNDDWGTLTEKRLGLGKIDTLRFGSNPERGGPPLPLGVPPP